MSTPILVLDDDLSARAYTLHQKNLTAHRAAAEAHARLQQEAHAAKSRDPDFDLDSALEKLGPAPTAPGWHDAVVAARTAREAEKTAAQAQPSQ